MWSGRELNPRHEDFQSSALPTELPDRLVGIANITNRREKRIWLSLLAARCSLLLPRCPREIHDGDKDAPWQEAKAKIIGELVVGLTKAHEQTRL